MVLSGVDMRIVSQGGTIDVPYETSAITNIDGVIRAKRGDDVYVMAEYVNPDVAELELKVMRMTYETTGQRNKVYRFAEDHGI